MNNDLPARYPGIRLGAAVIMPNHFNGILIIDDESTLTDGADVGDDMGTDVGAIHELPLRESIQSSSPGESPGQLPLLGSLP